MGLVQRVEAEVDFLDSNLVLINGSLRAVDLLPQVLQVLLLARDLTLSRVALDQQDGSGGSVGLYHRGHPTIPIPFGACHHLVPRTTLGDARVAARALARHAHARNVPMMT